MVKARKTLARRPKPQHPMLLFQSVWALGPTGFGREKEGVSRDQGTAETDPLGPIDAPPFSPGARAIIPWGCLVGGACCVQQQHRAGSS